MKRFCFVLIVSLLAFGKLIGQNLVPNPSFEDTVQCPTTQGQIDFAVGWQNPTGNTPDYFNSCFDNQMTTAYVDVPENFWGTEDARTGNAYAGFASLAFCIFNCREYIETGLVDTLIAGKKYCVSFWVSLSDSSTIGIDRIGAYFSDTMVSDNSTIEMLPFTPQVESQHGVPIIDTAGWVEVRDTFTAQGTEKWMIIGSFCTDSQFIRDTFVSAPYILSYYYIDDVSVTLVSDSIPPPDYDSISLTPSPSDGIVKLKGNFPTGTVLRIYDALGRDVGNIAVDCGNCERTLFLPFASGVYLYRVEAGEMLLKSGKLVIEK